jgi:hypothetical protein
MGTYFFPDWKRVWLFSIDTAVIRFEKKIGDVMCLSEAQIHHIQ